MRFQARCSVYMCKKADQYPRGDARALWHTMVPQLQLQNEGAAKKMQRDSRLALARLLHSLASNLQVSLWCHQGSVMKAKSSESSKSSERR